MHAALVVCTQFSCSVSHQTCLFVGQNMICLMIGAVKASPGDWLLGHGWAEANWGGELPLVTWVDHVTPKNPVMLSRMDMHMAVVNSEALRVAGLSDSAESPPGGRVDKDSEGKLTGILA